MKKKILSAVSALALMLGVMAMSSASVGTASAAIAAAPDSDDLRIVRVGTDAMGTDTVSNRNKEYVTFKNVSDGPVDIKDVLVEDNWAHERTLAHRAHTCNTYKITDLPGVGTNTEIAADEYVTVFNGERAGGDYKVNNEYRLYADSDPDCGTAGQYFDNNLDIVWVTLGNGTPLARKSWDWNSGYYVYGGGQ